MSSGDFLIAIADDLVPESGWDVQLDKMLNETQQETFVFTFTDDRCASMKRQENDTLLPRHPLISRSTYRRLGYLFNPKFDSVGPDLDLLIQSLVHGWLIDARELKLHHAIGPILNSKNEIICGCSTLGTEQVRTEAQNRMHSNSQAAWQQLKSDWDYFEITVGKLACVNRLSDYVYKSMKLQRKNWPLKIIVKSLVSYFLDKFIYPCFRR